MQFASKTIRMFLVVGIIVVLLSSQVSFPKAKGIETLNDERSFSYLSQRKMEEKENSRKFIEQYIQDLEEKELERKRAEDELQQVMAIKIISANALLEEITTNYTEANAEKERQIATLLAEVETGLKAYPESFSELREQYEVSKKSLDEYSQMIQSINDKMLSIQVSEDTDVSIVTGFTVTELKFVLRNVLKDVKDSDGNLIEIDETLVDELATTIVETVKSHAVNEVAVLAIMSHESWYFTSDYVKNHNNFGGMMHEDQTPYKYGTRIEGIAAAVRCIEFNMKSEKTIYEINESYCPGDSIWGEKVLQIMRLYVSSNIIKE